MLRTSTVVFLVCLGVMAVLCVMCIVYTLRKVNKVKFLRREIRAAMRERQKALAMVEKHKVDVILLECTSTIRQPEGEECPICLGGDEAEDPHEWVYLPTCSHRTHSECMRSWIAVCIAKDTHPACPLCRAMLTPPDVTETDPREREPATITAPTATTSDSDPAHVTIPVSSAEDSAPY
eukprot:TRINITY_DN21213_c0_g1_i1.p1 TRINITY_DN21213_c0_g1~~TRINITY_DN21213_c0_g1_i1.p1  ORF type:complete len:179 (+),score=10.01 TRINITY_DN21213_c0_g1_i1:51-587(+)